jgi:hypothetical protein
MGVGHVQWHRVDREAVTDLGSLFQGARLTSSQCSKLGADCVKDFGWRKPQRQGIGDEMPGAAPQLLIWREFLRLRACPAGRALAAGNHTASARTRDDRSVSCQLGIGMCRCVGGDPQRISQRAYAGKSLTEKQGAIRDEAVNDALDSHIGRHRRTVLELVIRSDDKLAHRRRPRAGRLRGRRRRGPNR